MVILPRFIRRRLKRWGYYVPTYRYTYRSLVKAFYFQELFERINTVEGDVVECGVGYGNSIVILASLVSLEGKDRRVIGFDSFEGFPNTGEDWSRASHFEGANYKRVQKRIQSANVPTSIHLEKGYFEHTLPQYQGKIAFLHIDVDIASSYVTVLKALFDNVVSGGVVLFDEYKNPHWEEATVAIDAFLPDYTFQKSKLHDKYYVIKK